MESSKKKLSLNIAGIEILYDFKKYIMTRHCLSMIREVSIIHFPSSNDKLLFQSCPLGVIDQDPGNDSDLQIMRFSRSKH